MVPSPKRWVSQEWRDRCQRRRRARQAPRLSLLPPRRARASAASCGDHAPTDPRRGKRCMPATQTRRWPAANAQVPLGRANTSRGRLTGPAPRLLSRRVSAAIDTRILVDAGRLPARKPAHNPAATPISMAMRKAVNHIHDESTIHPAFLCLITAAPGQFGAQIRAPNQRLNRMACQRLNDSNSPPPLVPQCLRAFPTT